MLCVAALLAALAAAAGAVGGWLVLTLTVWCCAWPSPRSRLAALPAASVCLVSSMVLVGLAGAVVPGISLQQVPAARAALIGLSLLPIAWLRRGAERRPSPTVRAEWLAAVPAGILALLGLAMALLPGWSPSDWLLRGGDSLEHVLYVGQVQQAGGLGYGHDPYPRGMHQAIALLVTAAGNAPRSGGSLLTALEATGLFTWGAYVLLVLATALAAAELSRALALPTGALGAVGAVAGGVLLGAAFFDFSMGFGFVTTVGLAAVMASVVHELARGEPSIAVVMACLALAAHTWQLAWPVFVLAALVAVRGAGRAGQRLRAALIGGAAVAAALPALLGAAEQVPASTVAAVGAIGPAPTAWIILGAGAAVLWCVIEVRSPARVGAGAVLLGAYALALLVGLASGEGLSAYYPRKLLWHAAAAGVPLVCALVGAAAHRLLRRIPLSADALRVAPLLACVALLVVGGLVLRVPWAAATGGWGRSGAVLEQLRTGATPLSGPESRPRVVAHLRDYYLPRR